MKENSYDDAGFFARYGEMERSVKGLGAAGEWPALRALLPDLAGKRVLDLGCGYGWHCRYARAQGAAHATGIDISGRMIARARAMTEDAAIDYRQDAIEDVTLADGGYEVVISSLALHYVADFAGACSAISRWLTPGGWFVFSVEHPIFTARGEQDWWYGPDGERDHWPVDGYQDEGERLTRFLGSEVTKYHRTFESYMNTVVAAGFVLHRVAEPKPPAAMVTERADLADESRRPMMLLVATTKPAI